jgi:hypothetical protein
MFLIHQRNEDKLMHLHFNYQRNEENQYILFFYNHRKIECNRSSTIDDLTLLAMAMPPANIPRECEFIPYENLPTILEIQKHPRNPDGKYHPKSRGYPAQAITLPLNSIGISPIFSSEGVVRSYQGYPKPICSSWS